MRNDRVTACVFSCVLACMLIACSSNSTLEDLGGETNWLTTCDDDARCGEYGSCMCGVCSESCEQDDDCPDGLVCKLPESELVSNACDADRAMGLCAPVCERTRDCGTEQICVEEACAPDPSASGNSGGGGSGGGGDGNGRYILHAIQPNADCSVSVDNPTLLAVGLLDISPGGQGVGSNCAVPYRVQFKLASVENELLQISGAEIRLTDGAQNPILFDQITPPPPNPFEVMSSRTILPAENGGPIEATMLIELIPELYARQLFNFDGQQLLAEIRVTARDASDNPVVFTPFVFPIDICDGCLTMCYTDIVAADLEISDVVPPDECNDNAGADGRVCIDTDC